MKQPVDHIMRPQLPWRIGPGVTECGLDASKVGVLTREQYFARAKELGVQRCMMLTCMTCAQTARNWKTWEEDPRSALGREIEWETRWRRDGERPVLLLDELHAIAALIEAHREEFDSYITNTRQRRDWLNQKARFAAAKKDETK